MSTPRSTQRESILAAAVRVALRDGALGLTLDAVAREAGVSKGGLLYHFAGKDALLAGMIEHFMRLLDEDARKRHDADPQPQGAWLRAYIDSSFASPGADGLDASEARKLWVSLLAAVAINSDLLAPLRDSYRVISERLAAEGAPLDQLILWLAADGLWIWDILGVLPLDTNLRDQLIARLRQLTYGGTP